MTRQTSFQMTKATEKQVAAIRDAGFGSTTDIIRIAIDRMAQQEIKPVSNATLQEMARTALNMWIFDEETDPEGEVKAGLEYIASDGEFDQDIIDSNIANGNDFDGLQDWALRLGQQM